MRRRNERGQALVLATLALGVFMIGAVGLALDTAQLYAQRQMAQAAADAAVQAAILSIFNNTNTGTNAFSEAPGYTHTCSTTDVITPCSYSRKNGFGGTAEDTVFIDTPTAAAVGLDPASLSSNDPVNLIRVTVRRAVPTWFVGLLGAPGTANVRASAVAAITGVIAPVPILVLHPDLEHSLSTNGTTMIQICGGPSKSVQVNSAAANAYAGPKAGGLIDLSRAGPMDNGICGTGTGADFGTFGGALTKPASIALGTTGNYVQPASMMEDPFGRFSPPDPPAGTPNPAPVNIPLGVHGCAFPTCREYSPGLYVNGLDISGGLPVIFKPGLYYVQGGGFTLKNVDGGGNLAADWNAMCVGCAEDPDTGAGMVVYDTGPAGSVLNNNPTGGFDINTNVRATLSGSTKLAGGAPAAPYYGILFWEDREADAHIGNQPTSAGGTHSLGQGNGCFTLVGNIYITNRMDIMAGDPSHYQEVTYNGTPCSTTVQRGNIIVSSLQIVGTTTIRMRLEPQGYLPVRRIALVK